MLDITPHTEDAQMLQLTNSFNVKGSVQIAPNFYILQTRCPHFLVCFRTETTEKGHLTFITVD